MLQRNCESDLEKWKRRVKEISLLMLLRAERIQKREFLQEGISTLLLPLQFIADFKLVKTSVTWSSDEQAYMDKKPKIIHDTSLRSFALNLILECTGLDSASFLIQFYPISLLVTTPNPYDCPCRSHDPQHNLFVGHLSPFFLHQSKNWLDVFCKHGENTIWAGGL